MWLFLFDMYSISVEQISSFQTFTLSNGAPERVTLNWKIPLH